MRAARSLNFLFVSLLRKKEKRGKEESIRVAASGGKKKKKREQFSKDLRDAPFSQREKKKKERDLGEGKKRKKIITFAQAIKKKKARPLRKKKKRKRSAQKDLVFSMAGEEGGNPRGGEKGEPRRGVCCLLLGASAH